MLVDVHSHILPGIDDGSKNMEETIKMLRMAQKEKIEENQEIKEQLQEEKQEENKEQTEE